MWRLVGSSADEAAEEDPENITFVGRYELFLPVPKDGEDVGEEKVTWNSGDKKRE